MTDVTLDDCANNPRKIGLRKTRINLKNLGTNPINTNQKILGPIKNFTFNYF